MRRRGRIRLILLLGVAALAVAVGVATYETDLFKSADLSTIDTRFSVRGNEKPPGDLVVVGIDPDTQLKLNEQFPFPRSFHARVIDRLKADGAKVIAFDIAISQPSKLQPKFCGFANADLPPDDCALIQSSSRAKNLVFSATEVGKNGSIPFIGQDATPAIMKQLGARAGYTGIVDDSDGSERRYLYGFNGLKSFASVVVEAEGHPPVPRSLFTGAGDSAWIDYYGGPGSIPTIPYWKVYRGLTPPGYFRGKTVVVGATDPVLKDVFHTATSGDQLMSGPELQAHAIGTVRRGNPLRAASGGVNVLLIVLLGLVTPLASMRLRLWGIGAALGVAALFVVAAQIAFDSGRIVTFVYPLVALLTGAVGSLVVQYFTETRERQRTKLLFSRFVPDSVVDQVLDQADDDLRLGGVQREGTVMFSDLRGFTSFAESLPVTQVIEVLNIYLGEMSAAILDNGGTLVAYMGDGIMAVFGAPIQQPDHADRALQAAREMLGPRLATFNDYLRAEGLGDGFRMGVGLNSGDVMSGNVGSQRRLEYTAIGDTTNTAARLEGMTKGTPHQLFLSDATRGFLQEEPPDLVHVGEFEVRGRTQKITLWSIADTGGAAPAPVAAAPAEAES
ncbi:MAG: adenylate cyclase [Thermoleophilaceae bacterium]|nr:adenylate cyclase [Thermoleophilaceae bacterium]